VPTDEKCYPNLSSFFKTPTLTSYDLILQLTQIKCLIQAAELLEWATIPVEELPEWGAIRVAGLLGWGVLQVEERQEWAATRVEGHPGCEILYIR